MLALRVFDGADGSRWSASVQDRNYEVLCLSQFTLYATVKGTKPDFHKSMRAEDSRPMFDHLVSRLSALAPSRVQRKFIEKVTLFFSTLQEQATTSLQFTLFTRMCICVACCYFSCYTFFHSLFSFFQLVRYRGLLWRLFFDRHPK